MATTSPAQRPAPTEPKGGGGTVLLVGNPNAGKTALFNALTGLRAKTANFPGITVDLRAGHLRLPAATVQLVDLPGLYSLDAITPEERIAEAALRGQIERLEHPDAVILVLDATNLERNLFLASEVLELGRPTVVALSLIDAARATQIDVDVEQLTAELKCPVVPVSARTGEGLEELRAMVARVLASEALQSAFEEPERCSVGCNACPFVARYDWAEQVARQTLRVPETHGSTTAAIDRILTKPVVGIAAFLAVMLGVFYLIFSLAQVPMTMIETGFAWAGQVVGAIIPTASSPGILWYASTFCAVLGVFVAAYWGAGVKLRWASGAVALAGAVLVSLLNPADFQSLAVDGVIGGVGGVIVFLPQICILFFFISLLEDSGYLARAAFVMERVMRSVGLPGKAFVPMLSAHACAIPGIMAARVIENWRDRLVTILILPLLTCSARLPVYAMVAALLFGSEPLKAAGVYLGAYLLGIVVALGTAFCLKKSILRGETVPLILELPPYRLPSLRNALMSMVDRATIFTRKAGSVILLISVVLWAMATFPKMPENQVASLRASAAGQEGAGADADADQFIAQEQLGYSVAGRIGRWVEPVFRPLGFDWKINVGVISSFAAREVIVSTLAIIYGISEESAEDTSTLTQTLRSQQRPGGSPVFTTSTCLSLLVFYVLAMQCLPTQVVTRRETGSWKWALLQLGYMTALAYTAALITYQGLRAFGVA